MLGKNRKKAAAETDKNLQIPVDFCAVIVYDKIAKYREPKKEKSDLANT